MTVQAATKPEQLAALLATLVELAADARYLRNRRWDDGDCRRIAIRMEDQVSRLDVVIENMKLELVEEGRSS